MSEANGLPAEVRIREVGPRDGLQTEDPVDPAGRVRLIEALAGAGLQQIEAVAFVSPKAVPSMAGAAEVMAAVDRQPAITYVALVPNVRGAQMAVDAGIESLSVTLSASAEYNQRNVRMSIEESLDQVAAIREAVGERPVDAVISCAFGSPYEGDIAPADVAALGERALEAGASSLTYADTTGMATPRRVADLVALTGNRIRLHLHETRGTGLVNAYAAMQLGVADFDCSVGGLGGSPFARGAAGNLATEDLVHLCADCGVTTGVDLDRLLEAAELAASLIGHPVPSRIAAAGPRWRLSTG